MNYFYSDPHFSHEAMLKYEPIRGEMFLNVPEMNEYLIKEYNKVVNRTDTVYFLGDISFCGKDETERLIRRMKGNKVLILGNHDRSRSPKFWMDVGFNWASKLPVIWENGIILSHEPIIEFGGVVPKNIHGHLHSKTTGLANHFCASVESTNFKPVSWEEIKNKT